MFVLKTNAQSQKQFKNSPRHSCRVTNVMTWLCDAFINWEIENSFEYNFIISELLLWLRIDWRLSSRCVIMSTKNANESILRCKVWIEVEVRNQNVLFFLCGTTAKLASIISEGTVMIRRSFKKTLKNLFRVLILTLKRDHMNLSNISISPRISRVFPAPASDEMNVSNFVANRIAWTIESDLLEIVIFAKEKTPTSITFQIVTKVDANQTKLQQIESFEVVVTTP